MTLNPMVSIYVNIIFVILTALTGCAAQFTTLLGSTGELIAMAVIAILLAIVNGILHAIPSQSGPTGAAQFPLGPK